MHPLFYQPEKEGPLVSSDGKKPKKRKENPGTKNSTNSEVTPPKRPRTVRAIFNHLTSEQSGVERWRVFHSSPKT